MALGFSPYQFSVLITSEVTERYSTNTPYDFVAESCQLLDFDSNTYEVALIQV